MSFWEPGSHVWHEVQPVSFISGHQNYLGYHLQMHHWLWVFLRIGCRPCRSEVLTRICFLSLKIKQQNPNQQSLPRTELTPIGNTFWRRRAETLARQCAQAWLTISYVGLCNVLVVHDHFMLSTLLCCQMLLVNVLPFHLKRHQFIYLNL